GKANRSTTPRRCAPRPRDWRSGPPCPAPTGSSATCCRPSRWSSGAPVPTGCTAGSATTCRSRPGTRQGCSPSGRRPLPTAAPLHGRVSRRREKDDAMEHALLTTAMARVPGPVTVVTTVDGSGRRWGCTAPSFSPVSLDPPLVLVCLDKKASSHPAFTAARHLMVNVLAHGQEEVARWFAAAGTDRFSDGDMRPCELGLP